MTPAITDGYRYVLLYAGAQKPVTRKVSPLVCAAFHGRCPPEQECRHLDGKRLNDAADNLAWGTRKQNSADKVIHGTAPRGIKNPNAKLTDFQISEIRSLKGTMRQCDIAVKFGTTQGHISRIHRGAQRVALTQ